MISFVPPYHGWLGNMMFQFAATCSLAMERGVECGWPAGKNIGQHTPLTLYDVFPIKATRRIIQPDSLYVERGFHFDPTFYDLPDGTMLKGYFQSEKYFRRHEAEIRNAFQVPFPHSRDAVSVHVRRGDYVTSFPNDHPPLGVDYYREAMGRFPGAKFMVFSDDPGWCLLNLAPLGNVEIVTGNPAIMDMNMMSQCNQGHIIANSSFSWWGAWRDSNPHKVVIAPRVWFGPAKADWRTDDLLPTEWVKI